MAEELHLNRQEEVSGLCDWLLHGHHTTVVVHIFGTENTLLIPTDDGEQNFIPRDDTGRAHAENIDGNLNVGRKREVIRSYSQGQALAFLIVVTWQTLTTTARKVRRQEKGGRLATILQAGEEKGEAKETLTS